ncbi:metal-dependent hydrolase [Oxalobacter vibrioformis]|uniref:metal-dependent hydrolase n=1 Tax=Oxalobacter vibrioformis TaxID=933080 RepID=UPI0022AED50F|nr:metal-dependent hydrolase [Oxalobacter vibrioformis]
MPTLFTHAAIPVGLGIGLGKKTIPTRLLVTGILFSVIPDFDGIGFWTGIAYGSTIGHRGLTHSLVFAVLLALFGTLFFKWFRTTARATFFFLLLTTVSHTLLDSITNGGLGVVFFWPWSNKRYFLPWQVIEVSPIRISDFLSRRGYVVLISELKWIWAPCLSAGFILMATRRIFFRRS